MHEILEHIKNGTEILEPRLDVRKLLENYSMGLYAELCCNRIIDANLLDGKYVEVDIFHGKNIYLDKVGIIKCEDILLSYLTQENIEEVEDDIYKYSDIIGKRNTILFYLRCETKEELKRLERETKGEEVSKLFQTELRNRKITHKIYVKLKKKIENIMTKLLYRKQISLIKEMNFPKQKSFLIEKAFLKYSHKKINQKNLEKYVWLGVSYIKESKKGKSAEEIKKKYKQAEKIVEAIGRLTPRTLMQMFPLEKKYDGEKQQIKDYFYAIKEIEKKGIDEPIGKENVEGFLWDYINIDISFFLIRWMGIVEDLSIYAKIEEPYKEVLKREEQYFHIKLIKE